VRGSSTNGSFAALNASRVEQLSLEYANFSLIDFVSVEVERARR